MATLKETIFQEIQNIQDDDLLNDIHQLLQNVYSTKHILIINNEQKKSIEEARQDYEAGRFYSTDTLFKDLLDE